jgi:cytochrome c-type biogenesis protein CcmH/NrfG
MNQPTAFDRPIPPAPEASLWKPVATVVSVVLVAVLLLFAFPYVARMLPTPAAMRPFLGYRSEKEARKALQQNPNDAPAHMTIAKAAQARRDKGVALHEWQEAARLDPDNSSYQMSLAFELLGQQKQEEARPLLEAVAQKKDDYAPIAARLLRTLSYYKTNPAPLTASKPSTDK